VIARVDGQPDGAGGFGDAAVDGLADPPRRIRRKLETLAPLELVHSTQQPEIPLLDEVKECQSRRPIALGDRDDQAQVRLHEDAPRRIAVPGPAAELTAACRLRCRRIFELSARLGARFDALGQADLVVFSQQGMASDVGEIQMNEVRVVARGVPRSRHERSPLAADDEAALEDSSTASCAARGARKLFCSSCSCPKGA
jgi:hypothetical protein